MISKPAVAKLKYTIDGANENAKQLATAACELAAIIVTGGSADIVVGVYDTRDGANGVEMSTANAIFVGANQGESIPFTPAVTIPFKKGVYVRIEQGGGVFNGKATVVLL